MVKSKKAVKTNAVRLIEREKVIFRLIEYDIEDALIDGVSVAEKTGQRVETVFKTLVTIGANKSIHIFIIPVAEILDLKKAAKVADVKKLDLLPLEALTKETGYIRGGCSPVGMKRLYPTFIHHTANGLTEMIVSAGKPGLQMALAPADLVRLTAAKMVDICSEREQMD